MKPFICSFLCLLTLTGCWSEPELPAKYFDDPQKLLLETITYRDVDLYQMDEDDKDYAKEVVAIDNVATVNVTHQAKGSLIDQIEVDIESAQADHRSVYYFDQGRLTEVRKSVRSYHQPKWSDEFNAEVYETEDTYFRFVSNEVELAEVEKKGMVIDCSSYQKCEEVFAAEIDQIFHDIRQYEWLGYES